MTPDRVRHFDSTASAALRCILSVAFITASGCSQERPDVFYPRVSVEGRVTRGQEAFRRGWVEIVPTEGGKGVLRSGAIGSDGRFRVDGLGPGRHGIRIVVPRDNSLYPFDRFFSPIRRDLTEEPLQKIDIDLLRESPRLG
ncbi:hypothetical protein GC170_18740 [bacterium]|nr:hypothetical protein [bacterium]